jgi:preprotein translocase subunit SecE
MRYKTMAKKNRNDEVLDEEEMLPNEEETAEVEEVAADDESDAEELERARQERIAARQAAREAKKKRKNKKEKTDKPNILRRIGKWFKDLFLELKKVTWPSPKKVVKSTTIVIGVTLFFLAIVMLLDLGLSQLYQQLIRGLPEPPPSV